MPEQFKKHQRVNSTRLRRWNYAWKGNYFVTTVTRERQPFFGEIHRGRMNLNAIGKILEQEWLATPGLRPKMNIRLGEFVIMPNHFHGIITIGYNEFNDPNHPVETHCNASPRPQPQPSPQQQPDSASSHPQNRFGPQSNNLAAIIRGLKGSVTKQARQINPEFGWQSLFHDHLIQDQAAYDRISQYIRDNPKNWAG